MKNDKEPVLGMRVEFVGSGFGDGAMKRMALRGAVLLVAGLMSVGAHAADTFVKPTPEELSMTSLPGYPGAPAVILFHEQILTDDMHAELHYDRIKILTEEGKKYANVELPFTQLNVEQGHFIYYFGGSLGVAGEIVGRTIHPDGTVIPFTGKPYVKVVEKGPDAKFEATVFTMPDVEVGSIIEYRYTKRTGTDQFESPQWYVQKELYVKAAHYVWRPFVFPLSDKPFYITWYPVLPPGDHIVKTVLAPSSGFESPPQVYELTIKDVPPMVTEEFMPPTGSFSYRVLFAYSQYRAEDYWKEAGKVWSEHEDDSINPTSALKSATKAVIEGATSDDEKLQKIYALVMSLENTRYTREHEKREDKAEGEGKMKTSADVLDHKRGSELQLTELFVGMARAAGLKAYEMLVPDRSKEIFTPSWESFNQFDDVIAIVNVGGKDEFFDPGWRYTAYGHLAWQHTFVRGLRQTDGGNAELAQTPGDDYKANRTQRVANLDMDDKGEVTGTVKLTFIGAPAVRWRQAALRGDAESLDLGLRRHLEQMVPKTLEVKVGKIDGLEDYEKPLVVNYEIKGTMGSPTGKRLLVPADLFESGTVATFPHEKREQMIYFQYPQFTQDALRVNLPKSFDVEAVPDGGKFDLTNAEAYKLDVTKDATGFTTRRQHIQIEGIVQLKDYESLRKYYGQFESKDQESVVLKVAPAVSAVVGAGEVGPRGLE